MPINIGAGFNPSSDEPIDSRIVVASETDRLALESFNCYHGLVVFQQDTNELYVCTDPGDDDTDPSWQLLLTGNIIPNIAPYNGKFTVTQDLFALSVSSSQLTLNGDGINNIIIINSASNVPLIVNNEGLIVFDEFQYTPDPVSGGFLYSGSDFFIGLE